MGFVLARLLRWPRTSFQASSWCSSGVLGVGPSVVDAALCEFSYMDALFGAAAGEVVGTVGVFTAGFLVPDLKDHSSRVFVSLSAVHLCSPVGSMHNSGTWNLPAAIACGLLLSVPLGRDACCVFLRSWSPFQRYGKRWL